MPLNRRVRALLGCVLAVVLFVALNIWADRSLKSVRLDLTEDGLYTISDGTRAVLDSIREPVTLRFYASSGLEKLGPDYAALAKRVDELLRSYRQLAGGRLRVERFDPAPFSREEDLALADGIDGFADMLGGAQLFLGLAGTNSTNGWHQIPYLSPARTELLEYDLTRLVHDLANPDKTTVALLGDLPLKGDQTAQARPWGVMDAAERFFDIRAMFGSIDRIDDDIEIVWLAEPGGLDEVTLYAIDQFVMRGGRVLAFLDPHAESLITPGRPQPRTGSLETLKPLLDAWGVEIAPRRVVADRRGAVKVQMNRGGRVIVTDYPAWFAARAGTLAADDPVTANLSLLHFRSAGYITRRDGADVRIEPLVSSSAVARDIDLARIEYAPDPTALLADFEATGMQYVLAARVTGEARSAFPEGPPDTIEDETVRAEHRTEASGPLALLLVADSDMLRDDVWAEPALIPGAARVPFANNSDFVVNALDRLAGSDAMMGLRGRGISNRPFVVLEDMTRQAELSYRAKERTLLDTVSELERQLDALRGYEDGEGVILTPEQQDEIRNTRDAMFEARSELREVRYALEKDVRDLKTLLTLLNIWAVPALIAAFAVCFALWRTRRARLYRRGLA